MAFSLQTEDGTIYKPGGYAKYRVASQPSGVATSGILILIGESSQGADHASETTLQDTFFGPNQGAEVAAKYGHGPIVDAFNIAAVPASDDEIVGAPAGIYILKTNYSSKAQADLVRAGLTDYGILADQNFGEPGNGQSFTITENVSEVAPTKAFTYVPTPAASALALRVNGGAAAAVTVSTMTTPAAFVALFNALAGAPAQAMGGAAKEVITAWDDADELAIDATGNNVVITGSVAWDNTPVPGDLLVIPATNGAPAWYQSVQASCIVGGSNENQGVYVITSATSTTISATKIHDTNAESPTAPADVASAAVSTSHTDILVYSAVTVTNRTGTHRDIIATISGTITGTASSNSLTLTRSIDWDVQPQINDVIQIPSTAPAAWLASNSNLGWFRVTASSATTVTMTKLDTAVAPASFVATSQVDDIDLVCRRPAIDGVGKTLELTSTTNGDAILRTSANAVVLPIFVTSASEQQDKIAAQKLSSGVSEEITFGGDVVMLLGYEGTTATVTISNSQLTTAVAGGAGANLTINMKNFKTVSELASFVNSQTGYTCSAANNLLGQSLIYPDKDGVVIFDKGTFGICSSTTNKAGRIKKDARAFYLALSSGSQLLQLGAVTPAAANAGLPEAQALSFLTGGERGGTTDTDITAALRSAERLRANFVIPLFSRDASEDSADLLTDDASTYTIDSVHAQLKTHVIAMSQLKRRRNRQGFASFQGSFNDWKSKSTTLASFRIACTGQDFKAVSAEDGSIVQLQPWATAVDAAAMQAAGFYRDITKKGLNTSGIVYNDSTFSSDDDTDVEVALQNGLLIAGVPEDSGVGFEWISDQTTYGTDNNFVFNSIQAVYAADLITLTSAQKMERAFVGQSLADVSAASAAGVFSRIMGELKRLKLIAASDDAPAGFKNAVFKVVGNTMYVTAEVKLAVSLKFVTIQFVVTEIQQTASI